MQLYARAVEEADPLPRISGTGVEYQHRRKLHAPDSHGSEKLDPHRKRTGRAKSGCDPLGCRKLPTAQNPRARLLGRHPARTRQHIHPPHRKSHTLRLGPKPSVNVNRVVPLTDTYDRLLAAGHTCKLFYFDEASSTMEVVNLL